MFGFGGRGPKHPPEIVNQKELDVIRENSNKRSRSVHRDLNKIQNWKALHEQRGVPEDDSFKYVQDQIFKERNLYNDIRPYEDENEKGTQTDVADEEQNASSSSPLDFIKIENILLSNFLDENTSKVDPNVVWEGLHNLRNRLRQLHVDNIDLDEIRRRLECGIAKKLRRFYEILENLQKIHEIDVSTDSLLNTKQRNFVPVNHQNIFYALGKNREYLEQIQDFGHFHLATLKANAFRNITVAQEEITKRMSKKTKENRRIKSIVKLGDEVAGRPGSSRRVVSNETVTHHHHRHEVEPDNNANSNFDDETEKDVSEYLSKYQLKTPENPTEEFIAQVEALAQDLQMEIIDFSGTSGGTEYFKIDECLTQLVQSLEKIPHLDYPNLVPYKAKVIKFIFKLQEKLDQKCAN